MTAWATLADVPPSTWPEAARLDAPEAQLYLDAAQEACEAYAPALADGATVPARYKLAVIYHARDLYRAGQRQGDTDTVGAEDYPLRVRPLADAVKALLRPRQPVPTFGRAVTP